MADSSKTLFEDGENLQGAIGKALEERKALLCFVADGGEESSNWEAALLDSKIREQLKVTTVVLQLKAGSLQAGYLNSVCPVQSIPAIVIIHNAQLVANHQSGQTTLEQLREYLSTRYGSTSDQEAPESSSPGSSTTQHLDLPPSEGRMRLPNNAYDHLRNLTQQYISQGVSGKSLLVIQLALIASIENDDIRVAMQPLRDQVDTSVTEPSLPEDVTSRLLNTPASRMRDSAATDPSPAIPQVTAEQSAGSSSDQSSSSASQPPHQTVPTSMARAETPPSPEAPPHRTTSQPSQQHTSSPRRQQSPFAPSHQSIDSASLQAAQRQEYIAKQQTQAAERARVKAQIEADKNARKEAEAARAAAGRRAELANLRKANSTTLNPQPTDIRLQVRLFDGATIRSSFPADATVAKEVRGWIDRTVTEKAAASGSTTGQPYNLKLILTPQPNRQIEAGEEDTRLADLEGVNGSATMVMAPVRGYVDSYGAASASVGVVGSIAGGVQGLVGLGVGMVGTAAGMAIGGLGRLLGGGAVASSRISRQGQIQQRGGGSGQGPAGNTAAAVDASQSAGGHARMRTLADQRRNEDEENKRKGTQLYNGMGLNIQPRKDDDKGEST